MTKLRLAVFLAMFSLVFTNGIAAAAEQQQEKSVKAIHQVAPVYPEEAKRAKVEGRVMLDVTVEENGEVSMANVVNGHRLLNQAAIDAVKQWRFSNPFNEAVTIQLTLAFTLKAETPAPNEQTSTGGPALRNIHKVDAAYPEEARRNRIQGEVRVEITVNDAGQVIDARAVSGAEILRQASVEAAKQFRFENGFHKRVVASLTFNFVLGEKK
ncbi:MAG: energy transducer TonB [Acidobacteriota bacterium]